jgi:hypothetical protein
VIIKRTPLAGALETMDMPVPVSARRRGHGLTKNSAVEVRSPLTASPAKQSEKVFIIQVADAGDLELEQRVSPGIHVHGMNDPRAEKGIIQGIATRGGDHDHGVPGAKIQGLAVETRIFPARVIERLLRCIQLKQRPLILSPRLTLAHPFLVVIIP